MTDGKENKKLAAALLAWYDKNGRDLPWRVKGGAHPDPYAVLVSEFMLQQTGVSTVIPYFFRFMERFPTVAALAAAELEEVYLLWQGLGYYTRARSLHATARQVAGGFGGEFPRTRAEVLKLKGIGPYTAASFLAFAFDLPETVVDGNVVRVVCRLHGMAEPDMEFVREKAAALTSRERPSDYASAIMDLGATVCAPRNPSCLLCPWRTECKAFAAGNAEEIPVLKKLPKKVRNGRVYIIRNRAGGVFIRKRPGRGLLAGLYEFPWLEGDEILFPAAFEDAGLEVSHTFTHFKLMLGIFCLEAERVPLEGKFVASLEDYPLSTLMKKVWEKAKSY